MHYPKIGVYGPVCARGQGYRNTFNGSNCSIALWHVLFEVSRSPLTNEVMDDLERGCSSLESHKELGTQNLPSKVVLLEENEMINILAVCVCRIFW